MATITADVETGVATKSLRFTLTIFAGSFLLFLVQPMLARMALPRLGGSPSVWNSAMLVYQALLLAGYAYAHWLGRFTGRTQGAIHLGLVLTAALMLPIGLSAAQPSAEANSFLWVPWLLLLSVGPLFFVISAQAPLLQRWFAMTRGGDPYPLYVASNLGSFSGLIAYPLLLEPMLGVASQSLVWTIGYILLIALVAWCTVKLVPLTAGPAGEDKTASVERGTILRWVLLAAIPSGLMLATTLHLTTDVAPMPLLWVIPLGLYLLSFSVGFSERRGFAHLCQKLAPFTLLLTAATLFLAVHLPLMVVLPLVVANLFAVAVALHADLFERRPDPSRLTLFYLALAVGGVLGGLFCALVAPLLFDWTYENPILLVAAAFAVAGTPPVAALRIRLMSRPGSSRRLFALLLMLGTAAVYLSEGGVPTMTTYVLIAAMALIGILAVANRLLFAATIALILFCGGGWTKLSQSLTPGLLSRSYFGVTSIQSNDVGRALIHGTTVHGIQLIGTPERERSPQGYYSVHSGVGRALAAVPEFYGPNARVSIVGLGTGTLSCYARPSQRWTYYEIDPAIVELARDSGQFSFLRRCTPDARIILGDARLRIAEQAPASADALVVDAFSSDAVPMHLLTREAFQAYGRYLQPNGLIMVHISNRHLDLEPVVAAAARDLGWSAVIGRHRIDEAARGSFAYSSNWIALSPDPAPIAKLQAQDQAGFWKPLQSRPGFTGWTDDFGSILPLIRSLNR